MVYINKTYFNYCDEKLKHYSKIVLQNNSKLQIKLEKIYWEILTSLLDFASVKNEQVSQPTFSNERLLKDCAE